MTEACMFCGTVPNGDDKSCASYAQATKVTPQHPFGCPWLTRADRERWERLSAKRQQDDLQATISRLTEALQDVGNLADHCDEGDELAVCLQAIVKDAVGPHLTRNELRRPKSPAIAENERLRRALEDICANAELMPHSSDRWQGTIDVYGVPPDDIEAARAALATPPDTDARPVEDFADAFHRIRNELEFHHSRTIAEVISRNDGLYRIKGEQNPDYAKRIIATYLALTATLPDALARGEG